MNVKPTALTLKSKGGHLSVIQSEITVHSPDGKTAQIIGIWDTGATGTVITQKVVDLLGLAPSGVVQCHTANGVVNRNTFIVSISMPTGLKIEGVVVSNADALSGGCDALIGMDIINLGDFAITNHNGQTVMSFRVPSKKHIDYVVDINNENARMHPPKPIGNGRKGGGSKFHH